MNNIATLMNSNCYEQAPHWGRDKKSLSSLLETGPKYFLKSFEEREGNLVNTSLCLHS